MITYDNAIEALAHDPETEQRDIAMSCCYECTWGGDWDDDDPEDGCAGCDMPVMACRCGPGEP
jgi:hypothetical protein